MAGNLLIMDTMDQLKATAAKQVAAAIRRTLDSKDVCRLCLAGGSTPGGVYALLAEMSRNGVLPFGQIEILFGDERCVAPTHPDSNFLMAQASFGDQFDKFYAVRRVRGEDAVYSEAAAAYEQYLTQPIDVLLLGMGPDAHIASLFPGSVAFDLKADDPALAMAIVGPKPPPDRVTITPRVVREAAQTFVMVGGAEKASAVQSVFAKEGDVAEFPARMVSNATWLIERPAAQNIS